MSLFVWGRNSDGQCGDDIPSAKPANTIAMPRHIAMPAPVTAIACGTGQQGCTLAVVSGGALFSFGNDAGGRLGHPRDASATHLTSNPTPRRVEALSSVRVRQVSCSDLHALCLTDEGIVYSWGKQGRNGCLGRPVGPEQALPAAVALPTPACFVDCESGVSGAILADGSLRMWGTRAHTVHALATASLHSSHCGVCTVCGAGGAGMSMADWGWARRT